jgi:WD40 repeat protein
MCEEIGTLAIGTYDGILLCYRILNVSESCAERPASVPADHVGLFAVLLFTEHPHPSAVRSLAGSRRFLASGGYDGSISVFDIQRLALHGNFSHHEDSVDVLAFFKNSYLVSGSADKSVCLWRVADMWMMKRLSGHTGPVGAMAISPTGKFMLSAGRDGSLRMWDLMRGHNARTRAIGVSPVMLAFSDDSRRFLFAYDRVVQVVDGPTEASLFTFEHTKAVTCACVQGEGIWVGCADGHLCRWSMESGELIGEYVISQNRVKMVATAGKYIVVLTSAGEVIIGEVGEDNEVDTQMKWVIDNRITCGAFVPGSSC